MATRRSTADIKRNIRDIKIAQHKRYTQERYRYFVPTGVGEEFVQLIGNDKHFIYLLSAANGVGKTFLGVNTIAHLCFDSANPYFQHSIFKEFPYPKHIRIVSNPTALEQTIIPEMKNWFPKGRYTTAKKGKMYEAYWTTDTGWKIDLMTYEQDAKEFESATLGYVWLDEPPPQRIFKATVARMRKGGIIVITATPLMGSAWLYDSLISNKDPDVKRHGYTTYLEADVETACEEHGIRGFLSHDHIEKMISQYDAEDRQARVHGKFHHLIGLVFKSFNRRIHVIRPFEITHADFVVNHALDPHPRNPDAVLWLGISRKQQKFVIDELYGNFRTEELAARVKQRDTNYRIKRRISDPAAFIEDQHEETGLSLAARLAKHGVEYDKSTKDRVGADRSIKDALDYQQVGGEMLRAPDLYIFDNCERTIFELEHYRWQEWQGKTGEEKNPKERPVDKDDHMIENLGRLLLLDTRWTPIQPKRVRKSYRARGAYEGSG